MSLFDDIKADQLDARKTGGKAKAALLSTLLGEITKDGDASKTDDATVTKVIEKFVKNAEMSLAAVVGRIHQRDGMVEGIEQEIATLKAYLPLKMTREELIAAIALFKSQDPDAMVGAIMAHLKSDYPGKYDGKLAADVIKTWT